MVGAGLAGIGAASLLAERGFDVTLFERNPYIGGKVGSWDVTFADGYATKVDHGFHAFFRHYYNLRSFMEKIGAHRRFKTIDDYLVLAQDGKKYSFKNVETTPVLNILSLGKNKFFRFRDVLLNPPSWRMGEFLEYDEAKTFAKYDGMTFAEFASADSTAIALETDLQYFRARLLRAGGKVEHGRADEEFSLFLSQPRSWFAL